MTANRKSLGFVLALLLSMAASSTAAPGGCGSGGSLSTIGFEQVAVGGTAVGFTVATFTAGSAIPVLAVVVVESNAIRSRSDGLNPTATVGTPFAVASSFTVCGERAIRTVRFIQQSAAATISVEYYKEGN